MPENIKTDSEKAAYRAACQGLLDWVTQGFKPAGPDAIAPGPGKTQRKLPAEQYVNLRVTGLCSGLLRDSRLRDQIWTK